MKIDADGNANAHEGEGGQIQPQGLAGLGQKLRAVRCKNRDERIGKAVPDGKKQDTQKDRGDDRVAAVGSHRFVSICTEVDTDKRLNRLGYAHEQVEANQ